MRVHLAFQYIKFLLQAKPCVFLIFGKAFLPLLKI